MGAPHPGQPLDRPLAAPHPSVRELRTQMHDATAGDRLPYDLVECVHGGVRRRRQRQLAFSTTSLAVSEVAAAALLAGSSDGRTTRLDVAEPTEAPAAPAGRGAGVDAGTAAGPRPRAPPGDVAVLDDGAATLVVAPAATVSAAVVLSRSSHARWLILGTSRTARGSRGAT